MTTRTCCTVGPGRICFRPPTAVFNNNARSPLGAYLLYSPPSRSSLLYVPPPNARQYRYSRLVGNEITVSLRRPFILTDSESPRALLPHSPYTVERPLYFEKTKRPSGSTTRRGVIGSENTYLMITATRQSSFDHFIKFHFSIKRDGICVNSLVISR